MFSEESIEEIDLYKKPAAVSKNFGTFSSLLNIVHILGNEIQEQVTDETGIIFMHVDCQIEDILNKLFLSASLWIKRRAFERSML